MTQGWQTFDDSQGGDSVRQGLLDQRERTATLATNFAGPTAPSVSQGISVSPSIDIPTAGSPWFDTANGKFKIHTGTTWAEVCVLGVTQVSTAEIGSSAVTTAKLADNSVTTAKIAASAVTSAEIASSAVVSAGIASSAVTTAKIADSAVSSAKLASAAVTTAKLADDSVTAAKIADSAVGTDALASAAVTTAKLADGSVTAAKLATGSLGYNVVAKSASYTASANDFVIASLSQGTPGSWQLSLPASPTTGDKIGVYLLTVTAGDVLTVSAFHNIGSGGTTRKLYVVGDRLELIFTGSRWVPIAARTNTSGAPDSVLEEQYSAGTSAGATSVDTWHTRSLNTIVRNNGTALSLSASQFTPIQNGWVEYSTVGYAVGGGKARLYNVTDATTVSTGLTLDHSTTSAVELTGSGAVVAGKSYRIDMWTDLANTNGLGRARSADSGAIETFTRVRFWRDGGFDM